VIHGRRRLTAKMHIVENLAHTFRPVGITR
jgi:hypothetical protein